MTTPETLLTKVTLLCPADPHSMDSLKERTEEINFGVMVLKEIRNEENETDAVYALVREPPADESDDDKPVKSMDYEALDLPYPLIQKTAHVKIKNLLPLSAKVKLPILSATLVCAILRSGCYFRPNLNIYVADIDRMMDTCHELINQKAGNFSTESRIKSLRRWYEGIPLQAPQAKDPFEMYPKSTKLHKKIFKIAEIVKETYLEQGPIKKLLKELATQDMES